MWTSLLCQIHPNFKERGRQGNEEEEKETETPTSNISPATAGHSLSWS